MIEIMTATEVIARQKEWFRDLARAARADQKAHLRAMIEVGDAKGIFTFCCAQSRAYKDAMMDLTLFGWSQQKVDEASASWVFRYYKRLTGTRV